ncbi:hypothetical protein [Sphingomonas sp. CFBP8993]|uniref:hypothetical protein n=1 Tax=Sphingomonas sp. CFBP8993 TaxID=3096526 RepID=UPI002A6A8088|nr:hypothetical protein [Sphingomonas sp. CFBP8993]
MIDMIVSFVVKILAARAMPASKLRPMQGAGDKAPVGDPMAYPIPPVHGYVYAPMVKSLLNENAFMTKMAICLNDPVV